MGRTTPSSLNEAPARTGDDPEPSASENDAAAQLALAFGTGNARARSSSAASRRSPASADERGRVPPTPPSPAGSHRSPASGSLEIIEDGIRYEVSPARDPLLVPEGNVPPPRGQRAGAPHRGSHARVDARADVLPHVRENARTEASPEASGRAPGRHDVVFDEARIDPDVQKVLRRLVRHGHEAYLVGGGVRDLLLDRRPKDFDVATSARPEEVRELFRNSRIIGRRFRLVHVRFQGGKVIEVATFRKNPKEETDEPSSGDELLIRSDNVFGVASEDALRRDFTINALFYDLERKQVLDWVGGMEDVRRRVVHTIGDPETRFREDPVRILRALKFAGRLDLGITPDVYDAIVYCRETLALAARPRLSEEILRLLRGGQARRTIYLAWETGVLEVLLPELAALLYDDGAERGPGHRVFRLLDFIDRRTAEQGPLDDTVLWTLLLLEPMKEACDGSRDRAAAVAEFLEPLIERIAISRRYADGMRRIVAVLPRLVSGRAGRFARTEMFQLAIEVAAAELWSRGESTEAIDLLRTASRAPNAHPRPAEPHSGRRDREHDGSRRR